MAADTPDGNWKRVLAQSVRRKLHDEAALDGHVDRGDPAGARPAVPQGAGRPGGAAASPFAAGPGGSSPSAPVPAEYAPGAARPAAGWPAEGGPSAEWGAAEPVDRTLLWSGESFAAPGAESRGRVGAPGGWASAKAGGPAGAGPGGARGPRSAALVVDELRAHLLTPAEEKRALAILSGRRPSGSIGAFVASAAVAVVAASAGVFVLGRSPGGEGELRLAGELAPPREQTELSGAGTLDKLGAGVLSESKGHGLAAPAGGRAAGGASGRTPGQPGSAARADDDAAETVFRADMTFAGAPDRFELTGPLVDLDLRPPTSSAEATEPSVAERRRRSTSAGETPKRARNAAP